MFEVILGIFVGIGYAMVFPQAIARLKEKILNIFGHSSCDEDDKKNKRSKWDR